MSQYFRFHEIPSLALATAVFWLTFFGCGRQTADPQAEVSGHRPKPEAEPPRPGETSPPGKKQFVGSKTCYDCHTKFYELWSTSRHGLAMQPYSPEFAKKELKPQADDGGDRQTVVPRGDRREARLGPRERRRQGDALPDRPRHGRQERLLFPHAHAQGPLAGPARGL